MKKIEVEGYNQLPLFDRISTLLKGFSTSFHQSCYFESLLLAFDIHIVIFHVHPLTAF